VSGERSGENASGSPSGRWVVSTLTLPGQGLLGVTNVVGDLS
jgi:hypothetical protein